MTIEYQENSISSTPPITHPHAADSEQTHSSTVEFTDVHSSLSETLLHAVASIHGETITLRSLFGLIGEHGLLLFCAFLTIPFLVPVSIPGVSTVFGLVIILIGVGVTLNRIPWLPSRLMDHPFSAERLKEAMGRGAHMAAKIDTVIRPRILVLSESSVINRINGAALVVSGLLLMAPLGLIPFSNTLPALAILFFAIGILQRDGIFILLAYVMLLATMVYFSVLMLGAVFAGHSIRELMTMVYLPFYGF